MKALTKRRIQRNLLHVVLMKRSIFRLFLFFIFLGGTFHCTGAGCARGSFRAACIYAGGLGSVVSARLRREGIAQTSPNRLYGAGAYVDVHFSRWVQIESRRPLAALQPSTLGHQRDTYLIGPRVPIGTFKRITPYGKFLVGLGSGSFLTGHSFVLAYGGGVDYRLSRRFTVRAVDFEYQQWRVTPTLTPYGGSVGISYRIF